MNIVQIRLLRKQLFKEHKISFQSGDKAQINIYIYIYAHNIARRQKKIDTVQRTTKKIYK